MKTIEEYWDVFYDFSRTASDLSRNLAFAGIGIIWIVAIAKDNSTTLPTELLKPICLLAISLACDLAQYVYATIAWYLFCLHKERKYGEDYKDKIKSNELINIPTWILFGVKIGFVAFAYMDLVSYMNKVFKCNLILPWQ